MKLNKVGHYSLPTKYYRTPGLHRIVFNQLNYLHTSEEKPSGQQLDSGDHPYNIVTKSVNVAGVSNNSPRLSHHIQHMITVTTEVQLV